VTAAAFFDVDGTLTRTTVLDPLVWYQRARLPWPRFAAWAAGLVAQAPVYYWIDRRSRSRFNVVFYRRYRGLNAADVREWHRRTFADNLQRTIFPAALECVREHQSAGRRVVLVTGALDAAIQPLGEFLRADAVIAARLEERDGVFTGAIQGPPVAEAEKAHRVRAYAAEHGIDLAGSFGYADSWADAAILECVGNAVAVNPSRRLRRAAGEREWPVVEWRVGGNPSAV
jgi:alcohol-forming fatty acyl-CoA reductase